MSFKVTFGPPSRIWCVYIKIAQTAKIAFFNARDDHPNYLSREVIRSQLVNSSQPDMTRVSVRVKQAIKEERFYECEVTVEGRDNISTGTYTRDNKGSGLTSVTVTGE